MLVIFYLVLLPVCCLMQVVTGQLEWWQGLLSWPLGILLGEFCRQLWLRICNA
ncbi:MAG: hypothetical protein Q7P63_01100 [Verrucomicrobiota bacterium JB022]|nr:hypothetical protein [Verrucomicrobiota bacterium JB022]